MRRLAAVLALAGLPFAAGAAERYELFTGASLLDLRGTTTDVYGATYDLHRDLHIDAGTQFQLAAHYDAGDGWWPTVGGAYAQLSGRGDAVATQPAVFGPLVVASGSLLHSRVDFDDYALDFAAPLKLAGVAIEPGVRVKYLDGRVRIDNTDSTVGGVITVAGMRSEQRVSRVFPLARLRLARDLTPWLKLVADGDYVEYGADKVWEYGVRADLRLARPLALSGGYQRRHYHVEDGQYRTNANLAGAFFGLTLETGP